MATKRKAAAMAASTEEDDEPVDPSDELIFTGLGGCQEVGRSCHILQYKGKTIMVPSSSLDTNDSISDTLV
jgi:cleavage and polyadenylation specificity factor subunit 3